MNKKTILALFPAVLFAQPLWAAAPEGRVMNLYGGQDRITFLIDKTGIVRYAVRGVPKNKELPKKLDEMEKKRP